MVLLWAGVPICPRPRLVGRAGGAQSVPFVAMPVPDWRQCAGASTLRFRPGFVSHLPRGRFLLDGQLRDQCGALGAAGFLHRNQEPVDKPLPNECLVATPLARRRHPRAEPRRLNLQTLKLA